MADLSRVDAAFMDLLGRSLSREPSGPGRAGSFAAWASTKGSQRPSNQDRIAIGRVERFKFALLADGMGGMRDGGQAATIAALTATRTCLSTAYLPLATVLKTALAAANEAVFGEYKGRGGAAVVLVAGTDDTIVIAHAGDARAYVIRIDGQLQQLTVDDTVRGQLEQMGRPPASAPKLEGALLQFVGMGPEFDPHVSVIKPQGAKGVLLTSDGVHSLPSEVMAWLARETPHGQLVTRLSMLSEWQGGRDNASAIYLSVHNLKADKGTEGFVEVWTPGDHFVVPAASREDEVVVNLVPESDRLKGARNRSTETLGSKRRASTRKRSGVSKKPRTRREPPKERQLPVMAFDSEASLSESDAPSQDVASRPAEPDAKKD